MPDNKEILTSETLDVKYERAFATLTDALCRNEELLKITNKSEDWLRGAGSVAMYDGGYYEKLIEDYRDEFADLFADKDYSDKLKNAVKCEVLRRLDAIAYNRHILDEYADILKSGRLETYEKHYPASISVCLTERLPDGSVHDYGRIYGYTPNSNVSLSINKYLSLKNLISLRERVFGKTCANGESELLYGKENRFGIYQIHNDISVARNIHFIGLQELEKIGFVTNRENYELVYTAPFTERVEFLSDRYCVLNRVFHDFNIDKPRDYTGRSVSVSDVIIFNCNGDISAHYVDNFGFAEIDGFFGETKTK